jgi:hypothetical protein
MVMPADSSDVPETRSGRSHRIELELSNMRQLFNSLDPSPFIEKDLDSRAEEFIVGWAQEFSPNSRLKLRINLEQWPTEDPSDLMRDAVHNYFRYRVKLNHLEFRRLMKRGRTSLMIGLAFLAGCLLMSRALPGGEISPWASFLKESLTIAGWVAMWRPMQIYLYDWWPVRQRGGVYAKLSRIPVEVLNTGMTRSANRATAARSADTP